MPKPVSRLLCAGVLLGLALPAPAQVAAPSPVSTLPAVQVQAARVRAVDDFELPASLTTVQEIGQGNGRGAQVSEALAGIPGLLARDRQNYAQDTQLSIRGFGARSSFGVRGVRLLADGVPATMPDGQGQLSHFNLLGADRIEVLRGPFSALYGNSSGGVVQLWSADGQAGDPWRLRSSVGSDNAVVTGLQLKGREGDVHYNVAASHIRTDGWREHSAARRESLNARFGVELAPGRRLELLFNHFDAPHAQDPLGLSREQLRADPRQATAVATQYNTRKSARQSQAGAVFTAQREQHTLRWMGYAGTRAVEQFLAIPPAPQNHPLHSGGVIGLDSDYGGIDARWAWQGQLAGRPLELVAGANADRQRQHRRGYENFVGAQLGVKGRLRRDQLDRVQNVDQFVQLWWQLAARWSALAGARHSQVRFRSADRYLAAGNPDDSGRRGYAATTPVAGLVFRASDALRLYASAGRGFETPTFNELGYRADGAAGLALDLGAARSRNMELGGKWRRHSGAHAELALFRADTDDELAVASNLNGRSTYRNIGRTRRQGVEAGYVQPLGGHAQLQLAWTFIEANVRQGYLACAGSGCTTPDTRVAAGTRLPGVPRQQLFARWQWQPRAWQFATEVVAASDTGINDAATATAPGHALLNLEASREWAAAAGALRLFARIDNALDRRYIGSVIVNDGNQRYFEPGPGRGGSVGLQWQWAR
ncbi:TonB-dependent receptor [Stenotrophomonas sp. YIM B06876]|uniref:TonB-dependent receptor family protein n=1 Tax=Stenotrophomonas sp. YIM B06876 TaxID=3060211 RepID=UPI002739A505|nr:TonB-dependent receptor [Stenotrophomonas sp. YIM B06876]